MVGRPITPRCSWLLSFSATSMLPWPSLQCTHTGHSPHHTLTYETRVVLQPTCYIAMEKPRKATDIQILAKLFLGLPEAHPQLT